MDEKDVECPKFAWIILVCIGCFDIIRGIVHTFFIEYAATNIVGLDLTCNRADQMVLLMIFGTSNYMTGAIYILIGLKARNLVPAMFAIIIFLFVIPAVIIFAIMQPTAAFSGGPLGPIYLIISSVVLIASYIHKRKIK